MDKLKGVVIFQTIVIITLAVLLSWFYAASLKPAERQKIIPGFLSERVYTGVLEPQSLLINNFETLQSGIKSFLQGNNISASVYVENLRNGANMGINDELGYFPASLNKLPVAVLIMQEIEDGKLTLNSTLPIKEIDRSDKSGNLYLAAGNELPVAVLLEKMIKESDNTAYNVLYDHIDEHKLARLLDYYNIKINVNYPQRRIEFINQTDSVTPASIYNFFSSLYLSTVLNPKDSEYLLSLLADTNFDIHKIADIPANVTIAQKYGAYYIKNSKFFHDCGIMYIQESKIFYCIMTKNLEVKPAEKVIGVTANSIYNYVVDERAKLDLYKKYIEEIP